MPLSDPIPRTAKMEPIARRFSGFQFSALHISVRGAQRKDDLSGHYAVCGPESENELRHRFDPGMMLSVRAPLVLEGCTNRIA